MVEAGATPAAGARFLTTWPMLTFMPAADTAGAVTEVTVRSGRTTCTAAVGRTLFPSSASITSPLTSARAIKKYVPAEALPGSPTGVAAVESAPGPRPAGTRRVASSVSPPATASVER